MLKNKIGGVKNCNKVLTVRESKKGSRRGFKGGSPVEKLHFHQALIFTRVTRLGEISPFG
jgi:hypothetical protein